MNRVRGILGSSRIPYAGAAFALLLTLPALTAGFAVDDWTFRWILLGLPDAPAAPSEMFSFLTGDPEANHAYMDMGVLPWWASPHIKAAFLRPVTVVTHLLDYQLWPDSAPLMHLHSLFWLAGIVLCAGLLYRRLLTPVWIAGLAALLFALDDAHGYPAGWLANRNALVATLFGLLSLITHDRWRRDQWAAGRWLSPAFLALSLFAAEFGLGTCAYLIAYAVFLDSQRWRRGLVHLLPHVGVFIAWAVVHTVGDYGTAASGVYLDPLGDPRRFLLAVAERGPILLLAQWAAPLADTYSPLSAEMAQRLWLIAVSVAALVTIALAPLLRRSATARFFYAGMLLSAVPVTATFPSNRLLLFIGVGAMGLIAQFLGGLLDRQTWVPQRRVGRVALWAVAVVLLPFHFLLAPLQLPIGAWIPSVVGVPAQAAAFSIPSHPQLSEQELVIVNAPDHLVFVSNLGSIRALQGLAYPKRLRGLVTTPVAFALERLDEWTLRAHAPGGMLKGTLGTLFRGPQDRLEEGERVELDGLTIRIVAMSDTHEPVTVDFRFAAVLEDSSMSWVRWQNGIYVPFSLPGVGESIEIEAARGPMEMMGANELIENHRLAAERVEEFFNRNE